MRDEIVSVDHWAASLPDPFLTCRDVGHYWKPWRAWWDTELRAYQRVLRCGRCKSERHQTINDRGHPVSGHYVYASNYLAPPGTGRLVAGDRDSLRLESVVRVIGTDNVHPIRKRKAG